RGVCPRGQSRRSALSFFRGLARGQSAFMFLFCSQACDKVTSMARTSAAARRPPAPEPSAPAGGFARRAPKSQPADKPSRPAAIDLNAPIDIEVAVETERRRGRGAQSNATGRFEPLARASFDDGWRTFEDLPPFKTTVTIDSTRRIITRNDSPDISFDL